MTSRYHYSKEDLIEALISVGLKKKDIVFVHNNVGFLGMPKGGSNVQNVFSTILDAFFSVIGASGTLIVPTFTYSFPHGKVFDPDLTPSDCGVFTEMLRKHPNAYRSHALAVSIA